LDPGFYFFGLLKPVFRKNFTYLDLPLFSGTSKDTATCCTKVDTMKPSIPAPSRHRFRHAFSEFFCTNFEWSSAIHEIGNYFHIDGAINSMSGDNGNWINLDWWANYIGGPYFNGKRVIYDL
jgi:hypothetical protein